MTATRSWQEAVICSDRYEVRGEVGKGGMARVYRAWDRTLECEVVLKVPHRALLEEEEFAERFTREIRSLVALSHPHIVRVTDVGRHDGVPFAVMQYLGGGSLRERRFADRSPATLDSWLPDIAAALDFMHARGYLHRDVKPANILFDEHGHAYLSDFGIAKALQAEGGQRRDRSLTNPGQAMGTPDYLAPEIILGKEVDGRADQYALAVTVYEWLSGRCPFDGPTPSAVFVQHSTEAPPPLQTFAPHLSPGLCAAVHKGLAKKPEERFPSCQAFVQALLDAPSTDVPPQAPSPAVGEEPVRLPCPRCGKSLRVPPETAGRRVQCPGCKASLKVDENRSSLRSVADRTDTAPFFGANTPTPLIARPAESLTPAGPSTPKPPIVPVDGQRLHGRLLAGAVLAVVVGLPLCIAAVVFSKRSGDSSVALEPRPSPTSPSLADATPKASPSGTSALPLPPAPPKTTGTGGARPLATPSATAVAATRQPALDSKVVRELNSLTEVQYLDTILTDVFNDFSIRHQVNFRIDEKTLAAQNIDLSNIFVTASYKRISARAALLNVLEDFGLSFFIKNEVIWITTKAEAERQNGSGPPNAAQTGRPMGFTAPSPTATRPAPASTPPLKAPAATHGVVKIHNRTSRQITVFAPEWIDASGNKASGSVLWSFDPKDMGTLDFKGSSLDASEFRYKLRTVDGISPESGKVWIARYKSGPYLDVFIDADDLPKADSSAAGRAGAPLDGETAGAFIKSVRYVGSGSANAFEVTVKLRRSGTYTVAAGFVKNNRMHRGSFSGDRYYGTSQVNGVVGQEIVVTIRNVPSPPLNTDYSAGVYDSSSDIKTDG